MIETIATTITETLGGMDQIGGNAGTLGETPGDGAVDPTEVRAEDGTKASNKIIAEIKTGTGMEIGTTGEVKVGAGAQDEGPGANPPTNPAMHHHGDTHICHCHHMRHQQTIIATKGTTRKARTQKMSRVGPTGPIPKFR